MLTGFLLLLKGNLPDKITRCHKDRRRKARNQYHAIIFTRGEALQTIDMNQVISCELKFTLIRFLNHMCQLRFFCAFACRTITWKKLLKCATCLKNLMRIMEYAHQQFWVFVNISLLEGWTTLD